MEVKVTVKTLLGASIVAGAGAVIGKRIGLTAVDLIDKVIDGVVVKKANNGSETAQRMCESRGLHYDGQNESEIKMGFRV